MRDAQTILTPKMYRELLVLCENMQYSQKGSYNITIGPFSILAYLKKNMITSESNILLILYIERKKEKKRYNLKKREMTKLTNIKKNMNHKVCSYKNYKSTYRKKKNIVKVHTN